MRVLRIDEHSPFRQLVGVGGLGTGMFFALEDNHTLGRNESRLGSLLDVRDYCKMHIVFHYVAKLLGAEQGQFSVLPLGKVGGDAAGAIVLSEMRGVGIDTRFVRVASGKPTLFSVCFQYPDGNGGNITTSNSAAGGFTEEDIDQAWYSLESIDPKTVAVLVPEVPLASRRHFLHLAKQAGAFCVASFVFGEIAAAKRLGMFDHLNLVSLNEEEAAEFVGEAHAGSNLESIVNRLGCLLTSRHPQLSVVMSAGKDGAYCIDRSGWSYSPAPTVEVASTAGAGDCLLGGILAALAAGITLRRMRGQTEKGPRLETAVDFGVLLASYKVSSPHTIHPTASLDTLLQFTEQFTIPIAPQIQQLFTEVEVIKANS
ncbi:MAG TPA: PfkB family carbohydrate kinase [Candidatus Sulfotelmatobacter sp.]|nr:PfkB family carbohydrate kinase [Candidatus Sulfotelmatobacter sp.]